MIPLQDYLLFLFCFVFFVLGPQAGYLGHGSLQLPGTAASPDTLPSPPAPLLVTLYNVIIPTIFLTPQWSCLCRGFLVLQRDRGVIVIMN